MSLSIGNNSKGSDASSDSGTMNHSQSSSKSKRVRDQFRALHFQYTIQTDLLGEEGVCTDEKNLLQSVWEESSAIRKSQGIRKLEPLNPLPRPAV